MMTTITKSLLFFSGILLLLLLLSTSTTTAYAQLGGTATFTDDTGFTVDLLPGWIANDYQNTGPEAAATEEQLGYTKLVTFCEASDAAPRLGSQVPTCDIGPFTDWVQVFRYKDFSNKPEIAATGTPLSSLTSNHVYLYHPEEIRRLHAAIVPGGWEPSIYEQFSQVTSVDRGAPGTMPGEMHMIDNEYNLFFLDESTDTAYRVTAGGYDIGYAWFNGGLLPGEVPDVVDVLMASVRLNPAPTSVSHQLFTYTPSNRPDLFDPGAIIVATEPAARPPPRSSSPLGP